MCGGEGSRLESSHEKPLHPIDGVAMIDRVLSALEDSRVDTRYAAVSPNAPATKAHLERAAGVRPVETDGDGYVADLMALLERPEIEPPILTVAADLPLLSGATIDRILAAHGESDGSRTVCVPVALKRRLGVSIDSTLESDEHLAPTGVNVVGDANEPESMTHVSYDPRLAINVNRREDAHVAADRLAVEDR